MKEIKNLDFFIILKQMLKTTQLELSEVKVKGSVTDTVVDYDRVMGWDGKMDADAILTEANLHADIKSKLELGASAYQKPTTGIPEVDLSQDVQDKLNSSVGATLENMSEVVVQKLSIGNFLLYASGKEFYIQHSSGDKWTFESTKLV